MATVRYTVHGVPPQWADAWFPMPTLTPAASSSVSRFTVGSPGTTPVFSPRPAGSMTLSRSPFWAPPSSVAPDYIWPQQYVNDIRELGPPVHYMPKRVAPLVPPVGIINTPPAPIAMRGRKVGGLRGMIWPRPNKVGS